MWDLLGKVKLKNKIFLDFAFSSVKIDFCMQFEQEEEDAQKFLQNMETLCHVAY